MGSFMERGNLQMDAKGKLRMAKTRSGKVPMPLVGADKLVVVMKPGNSGGAKGLGSLTLNVGQHEAGILLGRMLPFTTTRDCVARLNCVREEPMFKRKSNDWRMGAVWVQIELSQVEIDGHDESIHASKTSCAGNQPLDFRVDAFRQGVSYSMHVEVQDMMDTVTQHPGDVLDGFQPAPDGPAIPLPKEITRLILVALFPELLELFLDGPCSGRFQVRAPQKRKRPFLGRGHVGFVFEPQVLGTRKTLIVQRLQRPMFLLAHRVHGFIQMLGNMEFIEDDFVVRFRHPFFGGKDKGLPHVHAHRFDAYPLGIGQTLGIEVIQAFLFSFRLDVADARFSFPQLADHGDIFVASLESLLVDMDDVQSASSQSFLTNPRSTARAITPCTSFQESFNSSAACVRLQSKRTSMAKRSKSAVKREPFKAQGG